jgi:hypothetical protein
MATLRFTGLHKRGSLRWPAPYSKSLHVTATSRLTRGTLRCSLPQAGRTLVLSRSSADIHPSSKCCAGSRLCSPRTVCSVNIRGSSGCTALHWAADKGLVEMARALLQVATCDCNIKDNDGNTPLIAAANLGHSYVVEELCRHPSIE